MQVRRILLTIILASLTLAQDSNLKPLNLQELIDEGLANNPLRQSFYEDIRVAETLVPQSKSLPDPMLSLNLMNLPFENLGFDQEPMSGKQIMIMQGIPFPGKLNLKGQIAKSGVDIARNQYAEETNALTKNIIKTYYDLFFVDEAISTVKKNRQLLSEFLKVAEQKYAVGKGLQQDVLKAQVQLSLMTEKIINFQQKREIIKSNLNQLLNRPIDGSMGPTQKPDFKSISTQYAQLIEIAEAKRPVLIAWQNRVRRSEKKIELARKNLFPDLAITASYTQRDILQSGMGGADFLSTGISLNLPIYARSKQKQHITETQIELKSLQERYESVQQKVYQDINNGLTELNNNADLLELYRTGIVPQAAQSLESSLTGYQTDKVDFLTLISSELTLFNLELEHLRLLSAYQINIAELEFTIGASLPGN